MPIYGYKCSSCEHELEKIQKFSDEPLKKCPECEKDTLVKQVSTGGFCLFGHGWAKPGMSANPKKK